MDKILIVGKEPNRDTRGRFARKHRWILLTSLAGILFGSVVAFHVNFMDWMDQNTYQAPVETVFAAVNMEARVEALKEDILTRLMECESAGYTEDDGIIIFDSNGAISAGQFQFQKKTVVHFFKELYGEDLTSKEALLIALDTAKARNLARDIIFTVDGGVYNWENCAKKIGIIPEITVLKKLAE